MNSSTAQWIAILLGFLSGSLMIVILVFTPVVLKKRALRKAAKAAQDTPKTNEYIPEELGYSFGALIVGFIFFTIAIFVWNAIAHETLVWFSVTGIIWYLAGYTYYALQKVLKERKNSEKQ